MFPILCLTHIACLFSSALLAHSAFAADRVTILYDAFGANPAHTRDWGFSAQVLLLQFPDALAKKMAETMSRKPARPIIATAYGIGLAVPGSVDPSGIM